MKKRVVVIGLSLVGAVALVAVAYSLFFRPYVAGTRQASSPGAVFSALAGSLRGLPSGVTLTDGVADFSALGEQETLDGVERYLQDNDEVHAIKVDARGWQAESLLRLHEMRPDLTLMGTYQAGSVPLELDAADLDLSTAEADDVTAVARIAPALVCLRHVDAGHEEGHAKLAAVSALQQACADAEVRYRFDVQGQTFDLTSTDLDFRGVPMDDQGSEVREVLPYLPAVTHLDMDSCGVDDEHMAAIRDDFPNVDVVWRVWFAGYTVRTDATKIFASNPSVGGYLTNENTQCLKYCTKIKYLDIGHAGTVSDISFVSYMPDLEVFICILDGVSDITPLAQCTHLEFTELFSNSISDLTPLANLHELRHLNLGYDPYLSDLTPIMDLDLERLWLTPPNAIPYEQIAEYQERHPDCVVYNGPGDPHTNWRVGDRYALLREQIGYDTLEYSIAAYDPLYPSTV